MHSTVHISKQLISGDNPLIHMDGKDGNQLRITYASFIFIYLLSSKKKIQIFNSSLLKIKQWTLSNNPRCSKNNFALLSLQLILKQVYVFACTYMQKIIIIS
jgi:hypothetical protein